MAQNIKTHLYCYDDHRGFSEDVRKHFPDTGRYTVMSFQTREEFLSHLEKEKIHGFCKVAILGFHETKEQFEMIDHLAAEVKAIDRRTGLILLGPPDKVEEIKKIVRYNIDAYIPKNSNTLLRIHNTVKKIMSQHSIDIFTKKRNFSFYILMGFLFLSLLFVIFSFFRLPEYF
jgi:hypothetical protein